MRLLNKNLRLLLAYAIILLAVSIPAMLATISYIVRHEVDETLVLYRDQFKNKIKHFETLDDLETDLNVLDNLVYDIDIWAADPKTHSRDSLYTLYEYDSMAQEDRPLRALNSLVIIKEKPYLLTVKQSLINNKDLILSLGAAQVVVGLLLVFGLVLTNRLLSQKIWQPFYKTLSKLKAFDLDRHQSIEYEDTDIVEFRDLNTAIHQVTVRNRNIYHQQKEFIENVSHEIQTPLAVMRSKIDILMQSPHLSEDQSIVIQELGLSSQKLAKLSRNMLLLSKIENEQFTDKEIFDISLLISNVTANLKPLFDMHSINLHQNVQAHQFSGNKTLTEILVANLLTNAIRYNDVNGQVLVFGRQGELSVSNTGKPMDVPIEKLFERFAKGSSSQQGTGLGLAIINRIADTCGYQVKYSYAKSMHTFSVYF